MPWTLVLTIMLGVTWAILVPPSDPPNNSGLAPA